MPEPREAGLLDTSVVIDLGHLDAALLPQRVAICAVTLAELSAGPAATEDRAERARRQDRLQRVEAAFEPIAFGAEAARAYGRVYAAVDAVDAACRRLGTDRECRTRTLPLVGAAPREVLARLEEPTRLVRRYGTEAGRVAELGRRYPRFAGPVAEGVAYTGAEMLFGVLAEGALTVEDLVERRTRTSFVESAVPAAREVAAQVLELATT